MREIIIAGNWKMNTTPAEGVTLAKEIVESAAGEDKIKVVICPPATHLSAIKQVVNDTPVGLGAQNVHWEANGAFTGELSAEMIIAAGCEWVIIGHSERRTYFGETDHTVNKRLHRALSADIRPIVCIGETLQERESSRTFQVLERQLENGLEGVPAEISTGVVIAYEPVWAIGTGKTATVEQAQEAHRFIRDFFAKRFGRLFADTIVIQYGGSVNEKNAAELLACKDVDGALVGGASLKVEKFTSIIKAAMSV